MSYPSLIAETVTFVGHNGDSGEAYYAYPTRAGKFPGMVVIHHLPGWDEWITEVVRNPITAMRRFPRICTFVIARAVRTMSVRRCALQGELRTIRWRVTSPEL